MNTSICPVDVDAWASIPPLGNIDAYIRAVNAIPMLSLEEERLLAGKVGDTPNLAFAQKLILAHLKLVVSISRQYLGYGMSHADLIQEGNVGLMKAVRLFDSAYDVRVSSYAIPWIKAEIVDFVIKNFRMLRIATTKAHRKLFFNLRSLRTELASLDAMNNGGTRRETLSMDQAEKIAKMLNVSKEDVLEMESRLGRVDVTFESEDEDDALSPAQYLHDDSLEPTRIFAARERDWLSSTGIAIALENLDPRSRRIVEGRWLNDDDSCGLTLHDLAAEYGVSSERIRQIEAAALKKMRAALVEYA